MPIFAIMADAEDLDAVVDYPVHEKVGRSSDAHYSPVFAEFRATPGKILQRPCTKPNSIQLLHGNIGAGVAVEPIVDRSKIGQSLISPVEYHRC